jgi:hypothetical protein
MTDEQIQQVREALAAPCPAFHPAEPSPAEERWDSGRAAALAILDATEAQVSEALEARLTAAQARVKELETMVEQLRESLRTRVAFCDCCAARTRRDLGWSPGGPCDTCDADMALLYTKGREEGEA